MSTNGVRRSSEAPDAIVCGAGAGGLAAAAVLAKKGFRPRVLEKGESVATSWRGRYDTLRLNTLGWMSTQPGYRATKRRFGDYPHRDKWIEYLEGYAGEHELDLRFGVDVDRISRDPGGWVVETSKGSVRTPVVVVATGFDRVPRMPDLPGRDGFEGELIHAADYRNAEPFAGRDVLIIGPNTTGSELAFFVADGGASRVRVATRTPPNIFPRKWLGLHLNHPALVLDRLPPRLGDAIGRFGQRLIFGDLSEYGLPLPEKGVMGTLEDKQMGPAIDDGFVELVKAGRIEIVPAATGFDGADVLLADSSRIRPDAVIAATGYRRGLEPLVGHLGVLDETGYPLAVGSEQNPDAPGLFFIGYTTGLSGQLRRMRFEARAIGRAARRLRRQHGQKPVAEERSAVPA